MRITALFLSIFLTVQAEASCFRSHMEEAVELNRARSDQYARLSDGRSRAVSNRLIGAERGMIFGSYFLNIDLLASTYEQNGIGVTCEAYVPMSEVPAFRPKFVNGAVPKKNIFSLEKLRVKERLEQAFSSGDEKKLLAEARTLLRELSREKRIYCMTRHVIESIARIASLVATHERQALAKGLTSPRYLHELMILGHLWSLATSEEVDALALPLNRAGLPIVCQDVPPIPH